MAYFKSLFEKFPDAIEVKYITAEPVFGHHSALPCPETSRIQTEIFVSSLRCCSTMAKKAASGVPR